MSIKIGTYKFSFKNLREFLSIYKDIFILKEYGLKIENKSPMIIDCGSHIGLSIIYFKKMFPKASIIGFEANPNTFELLKKNILQNNLKDITLVNSAVAQKTGKIPFYVSKGKLNGWAWGDAGVKNAWYTPDNYKEIMVSSVRLSEFITKKIDLLKIDIEGMELFVISEIKPKLQFIDSIIMEFHGSLANKENSLTEILTILKNAKFAYSLFYPKTLFKPFRKEVTEEEIDRAKTTFLIIHAKKIPRDVKK